MLGVLCAGVFRNIAAAVDTKASSSRPSSKSKKHGKVTPLTSSNIFIPTASGRKKAGESEGVSLKKYEEALILPTLTRLLAGVDMTKLAHDLDGRGDIDQAVTLDSGAKEAALDEAALRAKMQGKAEEKAQTLMLALEVLAEMAASLDSRAGAGAGAEEEDEDEWLEDLDAEDVGEDEEMEMEDDVAEDEDDDDAFSKDGGDDDDMGVVADAARRGDTFADAVRRSGSMPFEGYAPVLCRILTSSDISLTASLLTLARPFEASFPSLSSASDSDNKPTSGLLRGLHLRSLSVLNNLLLRLASFSPPPPSQPATDPKDQRRIAAFRTWTAQASQSQKLNEVWRTLFEIAKGCASVPAVAGASAAPSAEGGIVGSAGTLGSVAGAGEGSDGLTMVETCIGTMWSLARILEGSVELSTTSPAFPYPTPTRRTVK